VLLSEIVLISQAVSPSARHPSVYQGMVLVTLEDLASGMEHIHSKNIIHGDLK
jgi:serine/threonine protein kinase